MNTFYFNSHHQFETLLQCTGFHSREVVGKNELTDFKRRIRHVSCLFLVLFMVSNRTIGQTICDAQLAPCIEQTGAVFPGGETLCERHDNFSPQITIPNNALASGLPTTVFTSKDIVIQGNFFVDLPVQFNYCRVRMDPGAKIIVTSESFKNDLLAFHTDFFSCSDMWEGIVLEAGGRCRFYWSEFEDAEYAMTVHEGSYLALYGNRFNRNFIGIRNAEENPTLPFLVFKNNVFDCTSALSDPTNLEVDFGEYDPVTFAGILLHNCSSSIGYFGANNRFNNLNYGILVTQRSTANILGCIFNDAQVATVIPPLAEAFPTVGAGVYGLESDIRIVGDSENQSCRFDKANLMTTSCNLTLSYAYFLDSSIGCDGGEHGATQIVEFNELFAEEEQSAITVRRSMASGSNAHTMIRNNLIINEVIDNDVSHFGIHLVGVNNPTDYAEVHDNTIEFTNPCVNAGIRHTVARSENAMFWDNSISFQNENFDWQGNGIFSFAGVTSGVEYYNNTINAIEYEGGDPTYGFNTSGVRGRIKNEGIKYCYNTTDNLSYGALFRGNCDNTNLYQNEILQHHVGLWINSQNSNPGIIGPQIRRVNEWLDESDDFGLLAALHSNPNIAEESEFVIRTEDASIERYLPSSSTISPAIGWFRPESGSNNYCLEAEPGDGISRFDSIIIDNDVAFDTLPEPVKFVQKKDLISVLLEEPALETEWSTFLGEEDENSEYLIASAEVALKEALQLNPVDQNNLDKLHNKVKSTYGRLVTFDAYNYANIDSVTFVVGTGLDSVLAILDSCHVYKEAQAALWATARSGLTTDLEAVYDMLDNIIPRADYDENYIFTYMCYISTLMDEPLEG